MWHILQLEAVDWFEHYNHSTNIAICHRGGKQRQTEVIAVSHVKTEACCVGLQEIRIMYAEVYHYCTRSVGSIQARL